MAKHICQKLGELYGKIIKTEDCIILLERILTDIPESVAAARERVEASLTAVKLELTWYYGELDGVHAKLEEEGLR